MIIPESVNEFEDENLRNKEEKVSVVFNLTV